MLSKRSILFFLTALFSLQPLAPAYALTSLNISVPIAPTAPKPPTSSNITNISADGNSETTVHITTSGSSTTTVIQNGTTISQSNTSTPTPTPQTSHTFLFSPRIPTRIPTPTLLFSRTTPTPTPTKTPTPTITPSGKTSNTPTPTATPTATPSAPTYDDKVKYMMDQINAYRASNGLTPVKTDPYTCNFAKVRAAEIVTDFSHTGFEQRISSNTLPYPTYSLIDENIAMTSNYKNVVTMWINSPGHAENMRRDTPYVCVQFSGNYYAYEGWRP